MEHKKQILLFIDNKIYADLLIEQIEYVKEFFVKNAHSKASFLEALSYSNLDAILLDIDSLDPNDAVMWKKINKLGANFPIIFMVGMHDLSNKLSQDHEELIKFIKKPFKINALIKQLKQSFDAYDRSAIANLSIGPYVFHPSSKMLIYLNTDKKTYLTDKETAILLYLFKANEQIVTRQTLLKEIWAYNDTVTTHTLETHIYRLRRKLELTPSKENFLITCPGGYKLCHS
jgi:DNA-binding response OmpR family regulator